MLQLFKTNKKLRPQLRERLSLRALKIKWATVELAKDNHKNSCKQAQGVWKIRLWKIANSPLWNLHKKIKEICKARHRIAIQKASDRNQLTNWATLLKRWENRPLHLKSAILRQSKLSKNWSRLRVWLNRSKIKKSKRKWYKNHPKRK